MQVVSNNVHIERLLLNFCSLFCKTQRIVNSNVKVFFFLTVKLEIKCISIVAHA